MADVEFRFAWGRHDQKLIDDARQFWREQDVMSEEDIEARAKQLCAIAYVGDKVAAVSTAVPYFYPPLKARFANYRTMVAPEFRRQRLATRLCIYSRDILANWSRENPEERLMGLLIVFRADEFKERRHVPVATQLGMQFVIVGNTSDGYHIRVVWFPEATIE